MYQFNSPYSLFPKSSISIDTSDTKTLTVSSELKVADPVITLDAPDSNYQGIVAKDPDNTTTGLIKSKTNSQWGLFKNLPTNFNGETIATPNYADLSLHKLYVENAVIDVGQTLTNLSNVITGLDINQSGTTLNLGNTASTNIINIGATASPNTINLGHAPEDNIYINGNIVQISGTNTTVNVSTVESKDQFITLNKGGTNATAINSGVFIEGTSASTAAYVKLADANTWAFKTPNQQFSINQDITTGATPTFQGITLTNPLATSAIPNLDASKITTGTLGMNTLVLPSTNGVAKIKYFLENNDPDEYYGVSLYSGDLRYSVSNWAGVKHSFGKYNNAGTYTTWLSINGDGVISETKITAKSGLEMTAGTLTLPANAITNSMIASGVDATKITTGTIDKARIPTILNAISVPGITMNTLGGVIDFGTGAVDPNFLAVNRRLITWADSAAANNKGRWGGIAHANYKRWDNSLTTWGTLYNVNNINEGHVFTLSINDVDDPDPTLDYERILEMNKNEAYFHKPVIVNAKITANTDLEVKGAVSSNTLYKGTKPSYAGMALSYNDDANPQWMLIANNSNIRFFNDATTANPLGVSPSFTITSGANRSFKDFTVGTIDASQNITVNTTISSAGNISTKSLNVSGTLTLPANAIKDAAIESITATKLTGTIDAARLPASLSYASTINQDLSTSASPNFFRLLLKNGADYTVTLNENGQIYALGQASVNSLFVRSGPVDLPSNSVSSDAIASVSASKISGPISSLFTATITTNNQNLTIGPSGRNFNYGSSRTILVTSNGTYSPTSMTFYFPTAPFQGETIEVISSVRYAMLHKNITVGSSFKECDGQVASSLTIPYGMSYKFLYDGTDWICINKSSKIISNLSSESLFTCVAPSSGSVVIGESAGGADTNLIYGDASTVIVSTQSNAINNNVIFAFPYPMNGRTITVINNCPMPLITQITYFKGVNVYNIPNGVSITFIRDEANNRWQVMQVSSVV